MMYIKASAGILLTTLQVVLVLVGIAVGLQLLTFLDAAVGKENAEAEYYNDLALACSQYKAAEVNR